MTDAVGILNLVINVTVGILNLIHEWCSQHSKTRSWQRAESAFSASFMNDARLNRHSWPQSWMVLGWISILSLVHEWRNTESPFSALFMNDATLNHHSQPCSWMTQHWITILSLVHEWRNTESPFSALFMNDATLNHLSQPQSEMIQGWIGILSFIHAWCRAESACFGIIHELKHSTYRSLSLCSRSDGVYSSKPGCVVCMVGVLTDVSLRFG